MYNAQGNQQMYTAEGSPVIYYPNGKHTPYKTPPLSDEMFNAQGDTVVIEKFNVNGPAFVSQAAKERYWAERSKNGFPVGASQWENKVREKYAWVENEPSFVPIDTNPMPPRVVQDPTFVAKTTPSNFRGATEREVKAYGKPASIPDRPNNVSNRGCFYNTDGSISCTQ